MVSVTMVHVDLNKFLSILVHPLRRFFEERRNADAVCKLVTEILDFHLKLILLLSDVPLHPVHELLQFVRVVVDVGSFGGRDVGWSYGAAARTAVTCERTDEQSLKFLPTRFLVNMHAKKAEKTSMISNQLMFFYLIHSLLKKLFKKLF